MRRRGFSEAENKGITIVDKQWDITSRLMDGVVVVR